MTSVDPIEPKIPTLQEVENAAAIIITKADDLTNTVMALEIKDEKDYDEVARVKADLLKPLLKKAEDERAMFSTTLRRMATAWDSRFKPGIDKLKGLMSYADQLMIDYTRAQQKAARELQAKLDAEAAEKQKLIDEAGLTSQIPEALPELAAKVETSHKTESGSRVTITTRRDIQIFDESLIPRHYLIPDVVRIKHDVLGGIEVPGVEIVYIDGVRQT